jgi:hypothetical protein
VSLPDRLHHAPQGSQHCRQVEGHGEWSVGALRDSAQTRPDQYFPFAIETFQLPSACACYNGAYVEPPHRK